MNKNILNLTDMLNSCITLIDPELHPAWRVVNLIPTVISKITCEPLPVKVTQSVPLKINSTVWVRNARYGDDRPIPLIVKPPGKRGSSLITGRRA